MSVIVKGMKMPISCDSCRIMDLEDTNCDPELFCGCPLVFKAHPQGEDRRPDYCPLVELPPHGDLIDRGEAERYALPRTEMVDGEIVQNKYVYLQTIQQLPTIIPAEEGA